MKVCLFLSWFFLYSINILSQNFVTAGPMLGHADADSMLVWVQTRQACTVKFSYWQVNDSLKKSITDKVQAKPENAFIAKATFRRLVAGSVYRYNVYLNDTLTELSFPLTFRARDIADSTFIVALGSCVGIPQDTSDFDIFKHIYSLRPDIMVWLGDNVYLNSEEWETKTKMVDAYNRHRSIVKLQPLLATANHYALWDDHDYGPNDAARNHPTKKLSREIFQLYWSNPTTGVNDQGIFTKFRWSDVEFFLTDNRYWRAPNLRLIGKKPYLGKAQLAWLINSLKTSDAKFKIIAVGNQVLNPVLYKENYSTYGRERNRLLRRLRINNITGVVFVSGDRHHTELTKREMGTNYPLYDLTVSPLTSGVHQNTGERNERRVENSLVREKNYALLEFSGNSNNRSMNIKIFNNKGVLLWQKLIKANDLTNQ